MLTPGPAVIDLYENLKYLKPLFDVRAIESFWSISTKSSMK